MYSIPNLHGYKHDNVSFAKRVLVEGEASEATGTTNEAIKTTGGIHITGNGVAGIAVAFMLILPLIIMIGCMNNVFVNQKRIDKPLLFGREDN